MDLQRYKPELLAPAGSLESLKMAVISGADAVYLGLGTLNARASASNFTLETLKPALDYAKLFGCRVYLTLNTILKNYEIPEAAELAAQAWNLGISAVIIQDLGLAAFLKRRYPHIVLHASTQMGVHNLFGARAASEMGIERVILARETPLAEILEISKGCDIQIEHFVHGALCCGFSGNCYFSSLVAGKSGNRGRCLQLCRKPYLLEDKSLVDEKGLFGNAQKGKDSAKKESFLQRGYWLSTRDTMLVDNLRELFEAGVCSFKIEGRMRRPEYVGEAVRVYRKAIDSLFSDSSEVNDCGSKVCSTGLDDRDKDCLRLMFNRGNFSRSHLFGVDENIVYPKLQNHMGLKLGEVTNVALGKAFLDCRVFKGDGIKFLRRGEEVGHALVLSDGNSTGFVGKVVSGDEVFVTDSAKKNDEIRARIRKLPLKIDACFCLEKQTCKVRLETSALLKPCNANGNEDSQGEQAKKGDANCGARTAEFEYSIKIESAKMRPLTFDDIKDCLTSLGNTNFCCNEFSTKTDAPFFTAKSVLKGLKRQFIDDFEQFLICSFYRPNASNTNEPANRLGNLKPIDVGKDSTIIMCRETDIELYSRFVDYIVVRPNSYKALLSDIERGAYAVRENKLLLDLPAIAFGEDIRILQRIVDSGVFYGFVVNNIYGFELAKNRPILLGYKTNLLNDIIGFPKIKSMEGNNQIEDRKKEISGDGVELRDFVYYFGRPDVMQFVHCYYKMIRGCSACKSGSDEIFLRDDRGECYQIRRQKISACYNMLVSSQPINLSKVSSVDRKFIDAVAITRQERECLLDFLKGKTGGIETQKALPIRSLD